jgi:hypothetical protein
MGGGRERTDKKRRESGCAAPDGAVVIPRFAPHRPASVRKQSTMQITPDRTQDIPSSSLATAVPVFVASHCAMLAQRGEPWAVLRSDSGHNSLKTPPIFAYQGTSPCRVGDQAQRPEQARHACFAGLKGL